MFFTCLKCSTHAQVGMHAAVHPGESCCTPAAEHSAGCVKAPPCAWAHLERCSNIRLRGCTSCLMCCPVQIWVQVMSLVTSLGQLLGTLPPEDPVGFLIVSANSGPAGHAHLSSDWLTQAHFVAFNGDSMLLRAPTLCVIVACLQANWCLATSMTFPAFQQCALLVLCAASNMCSANAGFPAHHVLQWAPPQRLHRLT